ncbi:MAG: hypothetical protein C4539_02580 [Ignavibacteriales bacterium]|nr:MAG: hypothetical protein C4539_02580 [Ignavibacteriales bacterium]
MEELKFNELMYAYTAGCLDYDEMKIFVEKFKYLNIDKIELGELQNVISFLPAILEPEKPGTYVKDEIAKKLRKYKSEILSVEKPEEDESIPVYEEPVEPPVEEFLNEEESLPENIVEEEVYHETDFELKEESNPEFENELLEENNYPATLEYVTEVQPADNEEKEQDNENINSVNDIELDSYYETEAISEPIEETEDKSYEKALIDEIQFQELREKEEAESTQDLHQELPKDDNKIKQPFQYPQDVHIAEYKGKQSNTGVIIFTTIVLILSLVAAAFIFFYFTQENDKSQKEIISLRSEVDGLNQELIRLNKVQRILSLLSSKDVWNLNLNGTIGNPTGFGKLIIDFSAHEGLIQLYNMPHSNDKMFYHLWVNVKDTALSLGSFIPKKDVEYIPLSEIPDINPAEINSVVLTLEESKEAKQPKGTEYLSTTIQQRRTR